MLQNLGVRDLPGNGLAAFIDKDSGRSHDVAACAAGVDLCDGVADRAGHAILIVRALLWCTLGQHAGKESDGIVTAFTMTRVLDTLLRCEKIDVAQVVRDTIGVGVCRLTPLLVRLLMAVTAVLGCREELWINELAVRGGRVRRQKMKVFAEVIVVVVRRLVVEGFVLVIGRCGFSACPNGGGVNQHGG